jgi:hypothetical protein
VSGVPAQEIPSRRLEFPVQESSQPTVGRGASTREFPGHTAWNFQCGSPQRQLSEEERSPDIFQAAPTEISIVGLRAEGGCA